MMNEIKIFKHEQFGNIRTLEINNEPWFVGKDVATVLGYTDTAHAILDHVDEDDRVNSKTQGQNVPELGQRGSWLINESGLYSLILSSKLPTAKQFKRWVTNDVLPTIRKHGMYARDELLDSPEFLMEVVQALKKERDEKIKLEQKIEKDKSKVEIGEAMMYEDGSIDLFNMHKVLQKNGINLGRNNFYLWCRKNNLLDKTKNYNLPTKNAVEEGILIDEIFPAIKNGKFIAMKHKVKVSKSGQNIIVKQLQKF